MTETIQGWQCVGCGRVEAPRNCVGICRDRKVELVHASDLVDALARLDRAEAQVEALRVLVRQIAVVTPRHGRWESSYRSLQERAQRLLAASATTAWPTGAPVPGRGEPKMPDQSLPFRSARGDTR